MNRPAPGAPRTDPAAVWQRSAWRRAARGLVLVWLALLLLAALTTGSAFLPIGAAHVAVSVGIAAVKAVLVAAFFMQLREPYPVLRMAALLALALLAILFALSATDYGWRSPPPPRPAARQPPPAAVQ
ncbi:hypothetical protein GCM10023144_26510 [Pigmentiphaga soli]|uniref:Caa(3)-type oxidase subunit IV n=1 Tax=Pigmentiphaga soli TaxID=1007095 RepID=A0ABP8H4P5_9BURK